MSNNNKNNNSPFEGGSQSGKTAPKGKKRLLYIILALVLAIAAPLFAKLNNGGTDPQTEIGTLHADDDTSVPTVADWEDDSTQAESEKEKPSSTEKSGESTTKKDTRKPTAEKTTAQTTLPPTVKESGHYTSKEDVALYIHLYGHLPDNFITKKQAQTLGWNGGSLEPYSPGSSIGGDRFGNYEGLLPKGRTYTECDIDTAGKKSRGAKRIVFSDRGEIYYTGDHYDSFTQLY